MKLTDFIPPEAIVTDFKAGDKNEAIEKLCRLAAKLAPGGLGFEEIRRVVLEREALGSTGVGLGVALPHGKSPHLETALMILARSEKGVDFDGPDGEAARIFILLISPEGPSAPGHLRILAALGRLFQSRDNVAAVKNARDASAIYDFLAGRDV